GRCYVGGPAFSCRRARPPSLFYPLSLHDALPISVMAQPRASCWRASARTLMGTRQGPSWTARASASMRSASLSSQAAWDDRDALDRKSTRLNSSHVSISYAVFCLKKEKPRRLSHE